jgi:Domain of unknown function (DU1801)
MVSSKETTAAGYLASLPAERRAVIAAVRTMITKHLPKGYEEAMNWGMLCYQVPLTTYPDTYNKQPLSYVGLAAQKNNYALYLTGVSEGTPARTRLQAAFTAKGKKMDMGGGCLRFKSLEELPMDVLSDIVASTPVAALVARFKEARTAKPVSRAEIAKIVEAKKVAKMAKQAARAQLATSVTAAKVATGVKKGSPAKAAKPARTAAEAKKTTVRKSSTTKASATKPSAGKPSARKAAATKRR